MSNKSSANSVRIIGGQWRGRRLPVLDRPGLRPTTDRVRETLLNWLMYDVQGAHCLDLCAGTGALSFECLSRGASSATLIESDSSVAKQLQANIELLSASATIIQQDALVFLKGLVTKPFDVVFVDPPYKLAIQAQLCQLLESQHWLHEKALVYVEQQAKQRDIIVPDNWQLHRTGQAGQSRYFLYHR